MRSSAHSLLKFLPTVQKFISRRDLRGRRKLYHWITAEFTSTTFAAEITAPDRIELLDKRFNKCWVIGQNAVLKVALFLALRAHPSSRKICRAKIRLHSINNDTLKMSSRAKHPLHRRPENRISIEIITPIRTRILRMNEPHLNAALHESIKHL